MFSEIDDFTLDLDNDILDDLFKLNEEPFNPPWKNIPMIQWSAEEVVDFIRSLGFCDACNIQRFKCISGNIFKTLEIGYCQLLAGSNEFGAIIYQAKENYIRSNPFSEEYHSIINKDYTANTQGPNTREDCVPKKAGRPKLNYKKREKSEKLWQFLLNLLKDQKTELIKWENYEEGTFKFVNNNSVARMWGSRNHNKTMNYEKFTRALRYHYKNKVLLPVPGKRLVYKFGPHAKGWRTSLPCY